MKVPSQKSRNEMHREHMELLKLPPVGRYDLVEVHMHPNDWELLNKWCASSEFYKGIPTYKGSPVKMLERFKVPEGKVYFARGCMCRDANLEWVEETEYLNQV